MTHTITREEAYKLLRKHAFENLPQGGRKEILECMPLEAWDEDPEFSSLPPELQRIIEEGDDIDDPQNPKYDMLVKMALRDRWVGVTNEWLLAELQEAGHDIDEIEGIPEVLETCPCCGYRTLEERYEYHICHVCWWEDDGQDSDDADRTGGPNHDVSLNMARGNFIRHGLFDP